MRREKKNESRKKNESGLRGGRARLKGRAEVTTMDYMFFDASAFNQDIGKWNTAKVIYMAGMFSYASAFNQKLCWDVTEKETDDIFDNAGCSGGGCWGTGTWPGACT